MRTKPIVFLVVLLLLVSGGVLARQLYCWSIDQKIERNQKIERKLKTVAEDFDALGKAMRSLGIDNCGIYLPSDTSWRSAERPTFETLRIYHPFAPNEGTGKRRSRSLTTPVAYIDQYPQDPFHPGQGYGFIAWSFFDGEPPAALLHSPGPDGDIDVRMARLFTIIDSRLPKDGGHSQQDGGHSLQFPNFDDKIHPCLNALRGRFAYDPTNGTVSNGDLIHFYIQGNDQAPEEIEAIAPISEEELDSLLKEYPATVEIPQPRWQDEGNAELAFVYEENLFPVRKPFYALVQHYLAGDEETAEEALYGLSNKFGPFADFFISPRKGGYLIEYKPLTEELVRQIEEWRQEDPAWWDLIDAVPEVGKHSYIHLDLERYARFFVFYGKSQLLNAGRLFAQGELKKAYRSVRVVEHLSEDLCSIYDGGPPAQSFGKMVGNEIHHMAYKLRLAIADQAKKEGVSLKEKKAP
jgi:hypothetical protein